MLASAIITSGRLEHGRSWDASRLDRMTHGLDRHCRRNLHHLPGAIARLRRCGRLADELHATYDVVLTPTLACETPRVGWLDPMQDYETVMGRLLQWVAYTPLAERHRRPGDLAAPGARPPPVCRRG